MAKIDIYKECPIYECEYFQLRLVEKGDAEDLLKCYGDVNTQELFNSDNCINDFNMDTIDQMERTISFWLNEYNARYYIRFAIIDKVRQKAIGTIEMFSRPIKQGSKESIGILRVDLHSDYEQSSFLEDLFKLIETHFFEAFEVDKIATKANEKAIARRNVLNAKGYVPFIKNDIIKYDDYYILYAEKTQVSI